MKIALYGGTFDPIHNGHVHIIETALKQLNVDKLIVIPNFQSPHKDQPLLSSEDRLTLVKMACASFKGVEVSAFEINGGKPAWTIDTVQYFKTLYPEASLFLILGDDAYASFDTWKKADDIRRLVTLVVARRNNETNTMVAETPHVLDLQNDYVDVSSSELRKKLLENINVLDDVPPGIIPKMKEMLG